MGKAVLIIERQERVLELLRQRKTSPLEELARELDVSASTIRRDLDALEARGLVERTHGGVIYRGEHEDEIQHSIALAERMKEHVEEKKEIARFAATLVSSQMTILLDGGSTVIYTARQIEARPLQVVTNSLGIANIFADDDGVELVLIGGTLYPRSGVLVGPIATGCVVDLHADLLLFSLAGIYENAGFNQNLEMAQVEQVMLQQAARSVLLMDSSKFGRKSLTRVCGLDEVDQIVTDSKVDLDWRDQIGARMIIVPPASRRTILGYPS